MPEPFDWTRCPEAAGPGQAAEDGEVIYGAAAPVPDYPVLSTAERERRFSRAFPEGVGASDMAAAAALGIEPSEIGAMT
jgi:hypothetical protein